MTYDRDYILRTSEALGLLSSALASTHVERERYGPNYPLLAESTVAKILKLRAELDAVTGLTDYLETYGTPLTAEEIDALGPLDTVNGTPHAPAAANP